MTDKASPRPEYDLAKLHAATDAAIATAHRMRRNIKGPINWADLSCRAAEKWTDQDGDTGYRVWIEEAAPGCDNSTFCEYIWKQLEKRGFLNIEVETEW